MGIDEKAQTFFGVQAHVVGPKDGERLCAVAHEGRYFIASGPIVILTFAESEALRKKASSGGLFSPDIIERIFQGNV